MWGHCDELNIWFHHLLVVNKQLYLLGGMALLIKKIMVTEQVVLMK